MRALYSLLLYLLLPAALLRLWIRGRSEPGYRRHWKERLGRATPRVSGAIWLHAVSVGEVRAAEPLVRALRERCPGTPLLLTVTTPGGRETVVRLFGDSVSCCYLPYDLPGAVQRFLAALRPVMAAFVEVELWPNLYAAIAARGIPLYLVNARLSARSLRRYARADALMRDTLACVTRVLAQSHADSLRFQQLGVDARRLLVTGNLKFAARLPDDWHTRAAQLRARLDGRQPVWVAASTHAGEEAPLLEVHRRVLQTYPHALLLLAPRHPIRAAGLLRDCRAAGMPACLFSEADATGAAVMVVDRLGHLMECYAVADMAFIGGSLVDRGGHNPVEALLAGAPVVCGPHPGNFTELYDRLAEAGAVRIVDDGHSLCGHLLDSFGDPQARQRALVAGQNVLTENRDVLPRILSVLIPEAKKGTDPIF